MGSAREYSFQTGEKNTFSLVDYIIFGATLLVSTFIGFFYAIKDRNVKDTKVFLLAGGGMNFIPVSMSLIASFMSAITLLGTPAEMYNYNTMYWWIGLSYGIAVAIAAHIFIPIFYRLKLTSIYEYLETRFSRSVRLMGSCMFSIQMLIYMSIVLYGPSLALNAVTGISLWGAIAAVGSLCTLYTAIGGMKAVLWTDTFQTIMMIMGLLATLIQGCIEMGGFSAAWNIAEENHRVYFTDFSPDPAVRHSFWALVIGSSFLWAAIYGTNQAQVQRAFTCKSLKHAQLAMWVNFPGLCVILMLACLNGIVMYAFYSTCDPVKFGLVKASDQLYPLFVMDILSHVPGIPGLFVACIFSGTLSTISSGLNSLSAVTLTDVIRPIFPDLSETRASNITKILSIVYGVVCLLLTYVASKLGNILQAALQVNGMLVAPMMGVFILGMIFPWSNYKGALVGTFTSLCMMLWIGVGAYIRQPVAWKAPISVQGCNWNLTLGTAAHNSSLQNISDFVDTSFKHIPPEGMDRLYSLSYLWFAATASTIVVGVGLIVSFLTGPENPKNIDPRLMCPLFDILFPFLPEKILKPLRFGINHEGKYEKDEKDDGEPTEVLLVQARKLTLPEIDVELTPKEENDSNGKLLEDAV